MTLHHTCGHIIKVSKEEADARGEPDAVPFGGLFQVRCGKTATSWRKDGIGPVKTWINGVLTEVDHPDGFRYVNGCCEEHAKTYPTHFGSMRVEMTLDEVIVWEVLTS